MSRTAGYVALAVILTAIITVALLPMVNDLISTHKIPYVGKYVREFIPKATITATATEHETTTQTELTTATETTTKLFPITITKLETLTVNRYFTTTERTTLTKTETETTTRTETSTTTSPITATKTETTTKTKTLTKTVTAAPPITYNEYNNQTPVVKLIENANSSILGFITFGNLFIWNQLSYEWLKNYTQMLIQDRHRGVKVAVYVKTITVCRIGNQTPKNPVIQLIN